jgi:hypothetical protein
VSREQADPKGASMTTIWERGARAGVEERLDRMDRWPDSDSSPHAVRAGLDSRNMDALVDLFVPDVQVGRDLDRS